MTDAHLLLRRHLARPAAVGLLVAIVAALVVATPTPARAEDTLSPDAPHFAYDAGPFTNVNVSGLLLDPCDVPEGCDEHEFTLDLPDGYYDALRASGRIGIVRIAVSWEGVDNDFDLALIDSDGNTLATSGFGNSDFERIVFTELPAGTYTIANTVFRAANTSIHVEVDLQDTVPAPTVARPGGDLAFSNSTPVTLERSSGEPHINAAPNGDLYVDFPLGAGTNSILFKSSDNGRTFRPLAPQHPNNNPLTNNAAGGGDSWTAIDADGRICFSELNTLVSLGVGCSTDGGATWEVADPLVIDPTTPLVDRQWMAATPQGEQFMAAQYGLVTVGTPDAGSRPGIRLAKEQPGGKWVNIAEIDTGRAMKSYDMVADPSDTDADGGTILQAYLRSNQGDDKLENPHQLMVWRSTDGGQTIQTHVVANLPTTPGNNFASIDTDEDGNVYVAWTEQGTWDVFYSVAARDDLDTWSDPVRVNLEPAATTAIQPVIRVGDRGRVFILFYAVDRAVNPDSFAQGAWHAYVAYALDGACQLDGCTAPTFFQTRVTEHPVQFRGICLGGTGCGGDPYYGDRSMLEYPFQVFAPETGQIHLVVTDSSRVNHGTTVTHYRQVTGPSAFAGAPDIDDPGVTATSVTDEEGDGGWPYVSPVPTTPAPGADITRVELTRTADTLRTVIQVADVSELDGALAAGAGQELLIGTRFATENDVLFLGMTYDGNEPAFVAGHLDGGILVDAYVPDDVPVTGTIVDESNTIEVEVPLDALTTTLEQPETVDTPAPVVQAVTEDQALYAVTAFAVVGVDSTTDDAAKHLLDVTPAFTTAGAARTPTAPPPSAAPDDGGDGGSLPGLPATGASLIVVLAGAVTVLGVGSRRRR